MNRENLTCGVCLDVFSNRIYMLTCGHNFCASCTSNLYIHYSTGEGLSCPVCRTVERRAYPVLPRNRALENVAIVSDVINNLLYFPI